MSFRQSVSDSRLNLRAGDVVEVRSREEILATLASDGAVDAMPFMPEMLEFCGKRFRVDKRADKTCDTIQHSGLRRLNDTVHLEGTRCSGAAHGGCEAACQLFWKEAWLKRVSDAPQGSEPVAAGSGCTEARLRAATVAEEPGTEDPTYVCQATRVAEATYPLRWWDVRHYAQDLTSGNVRLIDMLGVFVTWLCRTVAEAGVGCGSAIRWAYDHVQALHGGAPYPLRPGRVPKGAKTPGERLDLQPGEMVRVRSYPEILETLDTEWRNRGLYFDAEMVPFCSGTYRVRQRVERVIHEKTGKMLRFKNDAIILEGVECQSRYAKYRKFCPRAYYQYCREAWLQRVEPCPAERAGGDSACAGARDASAEVVETLR
jgi:hypothetical protein